MLAALVGHGVHPRGVNVNRLSLHDVYRWRLADAFAVTRQAARGAKSGARPHAVQRGLRDPPFRAAGPDRQPDEPGLVICGTVNINAAREVPRGQDGFCIAFDPEHVTLRREHLRPKETAA